MALADDYIRYADKVFRFLKDPTRLSYKQVRSSAKTIQEKFYGCAINQPRLLDSLVDDLRRLRSGDENAWDRLTRPLTNLTHIIPSPAPVYHNLEGIKMKIERKVLVQ